jgi:tripeptide aminopeptidase
VDGETTANVASIRGGSAINVVPDRVEVEGEVRSLEPARIDAWIEEAKGRFEEAAREAGATLRFESGWDFEPYELRPGTEVRRVVEETLLRVGLEPSPAVSAGGSDANALNARGLPTVNLGIGAQNPHSDEEFILLEDLAKAAEIAGELGRA